MKIKLNIEGMHCSSCASIIEQSLKELEGINQVSISLKNKTANIEFDEDSLSKEDIKSNITKLGYKLA